LNVPALCGRSAKLFYFALTSRMVTARHLGKDGFGNVTSALKVMSATHRDATTLAYVYLLPFIAHPRGIRARNRLRVDSRITGEDYSILPQHSNL
jgi:hypothetical protein